MVAIDRGRAMDFSTAVLRAALDVERGSRDRVISAFLCFLGGAIVVANVLIALYPARDDDPFYI
jgi:hypothetical protein